MTTSWDIETLERDPATGRVLVAHWRATRTAGGFSASVCGTTDLLPGPMGPSDPTFQPFESLTKEIVIGWLLAALTAPTHIPVAGVLAPTQFEEIEAYLDGQIAAQQSPPVVTGTPW